MKQSASEKLNYKLKQKHHLLCLNDFYNKPIKSLIMTSVNFYLVEIAKVLYGNTLYVKKIIMIKVYVEI